MFHDEYLIGIWSEGEMLKFRVVTVFYYQIQDRKCEPTHFHWATSARHKALLAAADHVKPRLEVRFLNDVCLEQIVWSKHRIYIYESNKTNSRRREFCTELSSCMKHYSIFLWRQYFTTVEAIISYWYQQQLNVILIIVITENRNQISNGIPIRKSCLSTIRSSAILQVQRQLIRRVSS